MAIGQLLVQIQGYLAGASTGQHCPVYSLVVASFAHRVPGAVNALQLGPASNNPIVPNSIAPYLSNLAIIFD
jgi:hypothetical protein